MLGKQSSGTSVQGKFPRGSEASTLPPRTTVQGERTALTPRGGSRAFSDQLAAGELLGDYSCKVTSSKIS